MALIPQTPFLITGSLRENIDVFGEAAEVDILEAALACHLGPVPLTCLPSVDVPSLQGA